MSGKYMKIKRVIIPTLTMVLLSSMLLGCSAATEEETYDILQQSTEIEPEYAAPEYDTAEDSQVKTLPWIQLSSLETHPELRAAFEELLGVTGTTGDKSGIIYTNSVDMTEQNNTLVIALGNTNFMNDYIRNDAQQSKIEEIANAEYTDLEDNQGVAAVINAYFELLPDQTDGQFDGTAALSRAQAMTLVMRATTPVNEAQAPDENADFTSVVGESLYTNFAAPMNMCSYLNTSNGLTDKNFNTTMSRGEYIYMIINATFNGISYMDLLATAGMEDEIFAEDVSLTTIKDGGDITFQESISNPDNGLPTDMYKTLARAVDLGFISEDDLDWDEAITKSDAINIFIDATEIYQTNIKEAYNTILGFVASAETGMNTSQPYYPSSTPCANVQKVQAWNDFCENWNESDYGTTTKGKTDIDFPYYGRTGYDASLLEYRTTDKGYTVFYDTATGRVYYTGMTLPTGVSWIERESGSAAVISQYILDNDNINNIYDITYAEYQELLGTYAGD